MRLSRRLRYVTLGTVLSAATGVLPAGPARAQPGTPVEYHGLRLTVPAAWPVIDLARQPTACARVDRHAVYLGRPGERSACPAGVAGRTETLTLRPLDGPVGPGTVVVRAGAALPRQLPDTVDHAVRIAVESAGVLVTATYGTDREPVQQAVAGATVTSTAGGHRAEPAPEAATEQVAAPGSFLGGFGFDACHTPSSSTMDAWLNSRYRAVGVYIGGGDLGCPDQPNLTPDWVVRQTGQGWHLFPIYVGRQAPCSREPFRITDPVNQGAQEADDAAARARALGMGPGSTIFNDLEYYPRGGSCSTAVLRYLSSWTDRLHAGGYRSGVYSSRAAAIADLGGYYHGSSYTMPDAIDFASWDGRPGTGDPNIPAGYWSGHQRMKQYTGGHNETYGGVTINIDSNFMDLSPGTHVFGAGSGTLYRIAGSSGDLQWYRQLNPDTGGSTFAAGSAAVLNHGWYTLGRVISGDDGVIYGITGTGALVWYRHTDPAGGGNTFAAGSGSVIDHGWNGFSTVFSGGNGVLYGVSPNGDLHWYRQLDPTGGGSAFAAGSGSVIGHGWDMFARVFADQGTIYGITPDGSLRWYRQLDPRGGTGPFAAGSGAVIDHGWDMFTIVFPGGDGVIYGVEPDGSLDWYRHADPGGGRATFAAGSGSTINRGWL